MIASRPFRIPRSRLAWVLAEHYARRFWPFLVSLPLFGVLALVFAPNDLVRLFGFVCVAWPLTIPLRAFLISGRAAGKFAVDCTVRLDGNALYFVGPGGGGMKLELSNLRTARRFNGCYVLETRKMSVAVMPDDVWEEPDREKLEKALRKHALQSRF